MASRRVRMAEQVWAGMALSWAGMALGWAWTSKLAGMALGVKRAIVERRDEEVLHSDGIVDEVRHIPAIDTYLAYGRAHACMRTCACTHAWTHARTNAHTRLDIGTRTRTDT